MNLFSLEHLLITIFCITLACFIAKYAENKAHRIWAYFNCAVATWSLGSFLASISKTSEEAIFYWRMAYFNVTFISILFYHFICAYCNVNRKNILILIYAQGIIFSFIILCTGLYINKAYFAFNSFYEFKATSCFNLWLGVWNIIVILAFYEFNIQIKTDKVRRIPSLIIFWAMLIGFTGGESTLFPNYGIMIYPGYQISICLYALLIAYGIFYHRLLPIDIVIKRSLIYSLLVAIISITYLLSVLISQQFFRQYFGYSSTIIGSIIIAIVFIPLKNIIQNFVDRFFLKATPLEMAQQNEQLRQEVAHTEKFKTVATLASGLAHEIKNPLTTLKTFAEYVPQKKNDPEFMEQYQKIIPQEIDRIDNLVHELLLFAKPSPPQMQSVNPNEIINNIALMLRQKTESSKILVEMRLNANTPIQADPNQLKQALLNLILNAIEAMPNGGTLTIITSLSFPNASVGNPEHFIIEISDTGHGITPKDLPHIFEPFFTKKEKGTGLGLSITQGIIEKHSGTIKVESKINQGTTFNIILLINHAF